MDKTIEYYNQNADVFARGTRLVDFTVIQEHFIKMIPSGSKILDFSCGSGRDTKYFLEKGYQVMATDGSVELCRLTRVFTGIEVKEMLSQELDLVNKFDGIWACSSILHLTKQELFSVIRKMHIALKDNGVIYTSFNTVILKGNVMVVILQILLKIRFRNLLKGYRNLQ